MVRGNKLVDAVRGGHNPALLDQRAAAADLLVEKLLLDYRHLPRILAKFGILAAHNLSSAGVVDAAAFWGCPKRKIVALATSSQTSKETTTTLTCIGNLLGQNDRARGV